MVKLTGFTGRVNRAVWGPLNKTIITAGEDGTLRQFDAQTGEMLQCVEAHAKQVSDLQFSKDSTHFVTASVDKVAKLWDTETLQHLKTYLSDRPINAAAVSPLYDHVILGGGQDASQVTTTSSKSGKFETKFYHKVFEEEFGNVRGHFGPINALAFAPDGRSFTSGGEEGYVRINHLDADYFVGKYIPGIKHVRTPLRPLLGGDPTLAPGSISVPLPANAPPDFLTPPTSVCPTGVSFPHSRVPSGLGPASTVARLPPFARSERRIASSC